MQFMLIAMLQSRWIVFLIIYYLKICFGQRRIIKGDEVNRDKRYMVYFLSSEDQETTYRDWLCAGALISTTYVLTAAACLTDVSRLYVIAGYKKYINSIDIEKDSCISKRKRRVMRICTPRTYKLNYEKLSDWMKIDIGIATVDEPYDFSDQSYRIDCSYTPGAIDVNYDPHLQMIGTSAVVMGWGSLKRYRQPDEIQDTNSEYLRYSKVRLSSVEGCVSYFTNHTGAGDIIKEFMICSRSEGFLDIDGKESKGTLPHIDGCRDGKQNKTHNLRTLYNISDEDDDFDWRRAADIERRFGTDLHHKGDTTYEDISDETSQSKPGFCQNDHGGPLVTWSGSKEYVIGVASACLVNSQTLLCLPPYLYTSTYCTGLFLQCVLSGSATSEVRRRCEEIAKEQGIAIEDHPVSWPEESESSNTNQQQSEQQQPPPQQQLQQESPHVMRSRDYITEDEPVDNVVTVNNNETTETKTETNELEDIATEREISVKIAKETVRKDPEEDYNPLEMILRLSNKKQEEKTRLEPKALRAKTETADFDPLAILQEDFMDETPERNADDNNEDTEVNTENIADITEQSDVVQTTIDNKTEITQVTVADNKTNKTKNADKNKNRKKS